MTIAEESAAIALLMTPDDLALALEPVARQYRLVLTLTADLDPADAARARRAWRGHLHRLLGEALNAVEWLS